MSRRFHSLAAWAVLMMLIPGPAALAQEGGPFPEWRVFGDTTTRFEYYSVPDDADKRALSRYPVAGGQYYSDLNINFSRRYSPFETVHANIFGLLNESDYRLDDRGLIVEHATVTWVKGDALVPFRARGGDYFGYLSARTLQAPLKGVELELQPNFGGPGLNHSFLLMTGTVQPNYTYDDFNYNEEIYSGASWLVEGEAIGAIALNVVHNYRAANLETGFPSRNQFVGSVAVETPFTLTGEPLLLEAEIAQFQGDHDSTGSIERDKSDYGHFVKLSRRGRGPLSYSVKNERYGADYRPNGSSVSADRMTWEARAGWRFAQGLHLRGRAQKFEDGIETSNPTTTLVGGISATGPLLQNSWPSLSGAFDTFIQTVGNADDSTDTRTVSASLNLTAPLDDALTWRMGLSYRNLDDRVADSRPITSQVSLALDSAFAFGELRGTLSPGVVVRHITGGSGRADEVGPSITLNLTGEGHRLVADYRYLFQDRHGPDTVNNVTHTTALAYGFAAGPHRLGADFDWERRDEQPGQRADSYRIGASYTFSFDRPALAARPAPTVSTPQATLLLSALPPGLALDGGRALIASFGIRRAIARPGLLIYETQFLPGIDQRQRLTLIHANGRLERSGVIIEFDDVGDLDTTAQTFARIRQIMIRRHGTPQRNFDRGSFATDLAASLRSGAFARIDEWQLADGILRFGIVRRLDDQVRIEAQYARRFPEPIRGQWALEQVR